jgi:hypothetical protein
MHAPVLPLAFFSQSGSSHCPPLLSEAVGAASAGNAAAGEAGAGESSGGIPRVDGVGIPSMFARVSKLIASEFISPPVAVAGRSAATSNGMVQQFSIFRTFRRQSSRALRRLREKTLFPSLGGFEIRTTFYLL